MVKIEPWVEFRFFNFRGAGRAGGCVFDGEVGEDGSDATSSVGDSTEDGGWVSGSINQLTPSHRFTSRFVVSSTAAK